MTEPPDTGRPEADVRFLLANERTLLAWIRTAITFQAGGLAATQLADSTVVGRVLGVVALLLGSWAGIIGLRRFRATEAAIRADRLPSASLQPTLLIGATVVLALVLLLVVAVGGW